MPVQLNIVTPQGEAFQGEVDGVVLPGSEGRFGVLEGHERFLAPLDIGEVEIATGADSVYAAISGAFADVAGELVVVLAEACELSGDIDVARAERARREAESEIQRLEVGEVEEQEFRQHEAALRRSLVRIQVAARHQ